MFGKIPKPEKHLFMCLQTRPAMHPRGSCSAKGAAAVYDKFAKVFEKRGLYNRFALTNCGCLGPCMKGPLLLVYPEGIMYASLKPEDVELIVEQHLIGGEPVESLRISSDVWG